MLFLLQLKMIWISLVEQSIISEPLWILSMYALINCCRDERHRQFLDVIRENKLKLTSIQVSKLPQNQ